MMQVSPTTLFLVEGCGQLGVAMCWGDGFITDLGIIGQTGISDPNPFFQTLLGKPYLNNVVISPHYYPPSVSGSKGQDTECATSSICHVRSTCHAADHIDIHVGPLDGKLWQCRGRTDTASSVPA